MRIPILVIAGLLFGLHPADADVLPQAMRGVWAVQPADCDPQSEGLLTIDVRTVLFYATAYDITRVVRRSDGSIRASGFSTNEGEAGREPDALTLKLIARDKLHVVTGRAETYSRCPKQAGRAR